MDASETDDESLVGDACHIVGESVDGPRGDSPLSSDDRDKYGNLVLLCKIHHKQVDDQRNTFTVERLQQIKSDHESWVKQSLQTDAAAQKDREIYASYLETWADLADLDGWQAWTSWLLSSGLPRMQVETDTRLEELRRWLFNRIFPGRHPGLESAFTNFRRVLADLQETFRKHAERHSSILATRKFYQIDNWDEEKYHRLADRFDKHVDLVQDLTLELTRAANYVCDHARQAIDPVYRIDDGVLTVMSGPNMKFEYVTWRPQYQGDERTDAPYPGLQDFQVIRAERDVHFGSGAIED